MTLYDAIKNRMMASPQRSVTAAGPRIFAPDPSMEATIAMRSARPEEYRHLIEANPGLGLQVALYEQGRRAAVATTDTEEEETDDAA